LVGGMVRAPRNRRARWADGCRAPKKLKLTDIKEMFLQTKDRV